MLARRVSLHRLRRSSAAAGIGARLVDRFRAGRPRRLSAVCQRHAPDRRAAAGNGAAGRRSEAIGTTAARPGTSVAGHTRLSRSRPLPAGGRALRLPLRLLPRGDAHPAGRARQAAAAARVDYAGSAARLGTAAGARIPAL